MVPCGVDCGCIEGCAKGWAFTTEPIIPEEVAELMEFLELPVKSVPLGSLHEQLTLF